MNTEDRSELQIFRIEVSGKLDRILDRLNNIEKKQNDQEDRLRSLERWKYAIPVTVVGVIAGAIVAVAS